MNATNRSVARVGLALCSLLAVAATGCRTHVVHTRTVYAPAPQPPPVVVVPPPEQPPVVVIQSENDFYEPLATYGRWVVVGSYGRCWIPARVEAGWRPYANGHWERTDAGWYWVSDEPWGWATYHYGRWDWHAAHGWFWVPHTQWAPAWVAWREGGGYVGWAPLRPSVTFGVSLTHVDYEPAFASRAFVFVEHRRMLEPVRPRNVVVNNTTIINNTVNITNVRVVNQTVINEGPRPEVIERATGRRVHGVSAREFRHREETAVAARERNIPTAIGRNAQPTVRHETRPTPAAAPALISQEVRAADRAAGMTKPPVVASQPSPQMTRPTPPPSTTTRPPLPPAQPMPKPTVHEERNQEVRKPAQDIPRREVLDVEKTGLVASQPPRPTASQVEAARPAGLDRKRADQAVRQAAPTPPRVEPQAKLEVKPAPAVPPRREARPMERPSVTAKPMPQPFSTDPIRGGKKREAAIADQHPATLPAVEPRPGHELRPEARHETRPPAKVETGAPAAAQRQIAPPSERPTDKRLATPKAKSHAAERDNAIKKSREEKGSKKQGEDQETPPTETSTRRPR